MSVSQACNKLYNDLDTVTVSWKATSIVDGNGVYSVLVGDCTGYDVFAILNSENNYFISRQWVVGTYLYLFIWKCNGTTLSPSMDALSEEGITVYKIRAHVK